MIFECASLSLAADNQAKNIALQLSQLIKFNARKRQQDQKVINVHVIDPPKLPLFPPTLVCSCTHAQGKKVLSLRYRHLT